MPFPIAHKFSTYGYVIFYADSNSVKIWRVYLSTIVRHWNSRKKGEKFVAHM